MSQRVNLISVCSSGHDTTKPQAEKSICARDGGQPRGGCNLISSLPGSPVGRQLTTRLPGMCVTVTAPDTVIRQILL